MARAFVAVQPPGAVLDAVEAAVAPVAPAMTGARFTTREPRHLTLQFLGNHVDLDAVGAALRSLAVRAGDVQLGGAGAFPSPRRARVLWLGVATGAELLVQLAASVGALLAPLGYEGEARPYHPHLTLARWKTPTDARTIVDAFGPAPVGEAWRLADVVLYESVLRSVGAQYVAREVVPLSD
jgi:RNA 2',3'-cyclic 3'-phosphodiesterase